MSLHRIPAVLLTLSLAIAGRARAQRPPTLPARDIAFARDGRLAASVEGDIWIRAAGGGRWTQLTHGADWDRQPAWSPDGTTLVFVSNRHGQDDLFRLRVASRGAAPERITTDTATDAEPAVGTDGTIWFVRGRRNDARLWKRTVGGEEVRVTTAALPESGPVLSPSGDRLAYIQDGGSGHRIRVRTLGATPLDSVVTSDHDPRAVSWSPGGDRLAFASYAPRPGLWVTPLDGRYANFVATGAGDIAWAPDGRTIVIAEHADEEVGYNGDPDRVGDRRRYETLAGTDRLLIVSAPVAPVMTPQAVPVAAVGDRAARNRETFARFAARIEKTHFATPDAAARAAEWRALVARLTPRAIDAPNDAALDDVIQEAIAARPVLREPAAGRAAVSSAHPVATAAGVEMLRRGGNVIDAAVAVSFALGVVEPDASGMGGYGEMVIRMQGMERPVVIEFMARVPEEATLANAALLQNGRYADDGPTLVMVPGTVAGMHKAWKRYGSGKLSWADLLAPAIRAARDGYVVSDGLATTLWLERARFAKYDASRALFFRNGVPRVAGDTIRNPDLAWTLEQVAAGGADGFYRGAVATRLVNDLRGKGNAMRTTDLARYFAADRDAVSTTYRGYTIFGSAPPVVGGATLAAQLNSLEQLPALAPYTTDAASMHAMISAWQLVPSSRNRVADPSLWPVDLSAFVSKDTARARWACFDPARALRGTDFRGDTLSCAALRPATPSTAPAATPRDRDADAALSGPVSATEPCNVQDHARAAECRAQGTTAFVVADAEGNAVAVTQTLGTWGGNFYVTPGLGFLYNDKLTSYGTDPALYGARLPYARHGSSISPTIVMRGSGADQRPVLAVGAAGNAWINAAVFQTVVGVLDFGLSPQRALEQPRFLPSARGAPGGGAGGLREFVIDLEDGVAPGVLRRLRELGHTINVISLRGELRMGYGAAIAIGASGVTAGADPRRAGTAGAVP